MSMKTTLIQAARIARRDLRGGLGAFRIFLLCLSLGVLAITAVGSVRGAIQEGLKREGAVMLGGQAELEFAFRFLAPLEKAWLLERAQRVSEIADFRSMAVVTRDGETERGLTQIKAVDASYPLVGSVQLAPAMPLDQALRGQEIYPGVVMQRVLMDRLGLAIGDTVRFGTKDFVLMAELVVEPDASSAGFSFGPRSILMRDDLRGSGLLDEGTLFEAKYRLALPENTDLDAFRAEAKARFAQSGMRWRDARRAAPGVERFVDRISSFLVLVGLAGLAVGGVGISASVRAYLAAKTATIATLRTLGAGRAVIFAAYLMQVAVLTALGVVIGVVLGAGLPMLLTPMIEARLPVPVESGLQWRAITEGAIFGTLTALIFALWPLARTEHIRPASLFRDGGAGQGWPRPGYLAVIGALAALLVGLAALSSDVPFLALWTAFGVSVSLIVLALAAHGLRWLARRAARRGTLRGRPALRWALAAIGGPREEAVSVVLSLGLGLTVLAAVGQIDRNLREAIEGDFPDRAPSYFFVDIQTDQLPGFLERVAQDPAVSRVDTAPNLRGVITRINGRPAAEVAGNHWVIRGDRGVSYAATQPDHVVMAEGSWWPADYTGPPLISFAAEEAGEMGIGIGDRLTVNILGRDIEGEIASLRHVDFSTAGIGFVMTMNPSALAGAPHTHIATVYAEEHAEAAILRDIAGASPNVTAIRVRDVVENVARVLRGVAAASAWAAAATLLTGVVVLIGAAAAGEQARIYEAAVLKTLGASRGRILMSFALRSCLLGAAAGLVALVAGAAAGWGVMVHLMEAEFRLIWSNAALVIFGGVLATLLAGIGFAWRPLAIRPARILRNAE